MANSERDIIRHFLVVKDGRGQRTIALQATSYSLGRDSHNTIVLHSPSVSRQHALLLRIALPNSDTYIFRIIDGNLQGQRSTNGVFINGDRHASRDLNHGDLIEFGAQGVRAVYYILSNLSHEEYQALCEADNLLVFLEGSGNEVATVVAEPLASKESSESVLIRLASFPELLLSPIVELDQWGQVSYLNPAALERFPQLRQDGLNHPILQGIHHQGTMGKNLVTRVVAWEGLFFEQTIHYLGNMNLLRVVMTDITARTAAEAELARHDRLLHALAEGSLALLMGHQHPQALEACLRELGQAAQVDRICLYENHPHPQTGTMAMSLRCEWVAEGVPSLRTQDHSQNQSYQAFALEDWYITLAGGKLVQGIVDTFPWDKQTFLRRDGVCSLLMAPILHGLELWGHLSFQDCQRERHWSESEASILLMAAANIGASLQRQQAEELQRYRATHDSLTGLPNRLAFNDRVEVCLQRSSQNLEDLAVLFIDLDHFKEVNDRFGHSAGDQLLIQVAQHLSQHMASTAFVAHWGGDEFTLLITGLSQQELNQQAKRLIQAMDQSFEVRGQNLYISISIGITHLTPKFQMGIDAETLIRQADIALYKAKAQGRNTWAFYEVDDNAQSVDLELEQNLRHALDRGELRVLYQPQVDLLSGRIIGIEALVRWQHPQRGLVSPGAFIAIAEERGWIVEIGTWVLRTACQQAKHWQDQGYPKIIMSVNLSPKQFRSASLVQDIAHILLETQLDPCCLELEVTESTAIQDLSYTQEILEQLSALGIRLSIDDFGTGYSSLNRLQNLPLHTLKIDQSFVREISRNAKVAHIITAIVALGRSLNLDLIAEGVELPEQMEFLKSVKCDTAQGYLFHHPMPPEDLDVIFEKIRDNF